MVKNMKVVLDASAIVAGLQLDDDRKYLITDAVLSEIRSKDALLRIEIKKEDGVLKVVNPEKHSVQIVKQRLKSLGEEGFLSDADISTLSLALEIKHKGEDVIIASDDYGIQNVAKSLSIEYAPLSEKGIEKVFTWHYVCRGCGEVYGKDIGFCNTCGSTVKRRVKH